MLEYNTPNSTPKKNPESIVKESVGMAINRSISISPIIMDPTIQWESFIAVVKPRFST